MKCKQCGTKAERVHTDTVFEYNNEERKAVNVPAFHCPHCEKTVVPDMIFLRLRDYAERFDDDIIDFVKCDEKDTEDMVAINMILNM